MEREELAKRIALLFEQTDGCVVLINGEWGTGKTYFWENYLKAEFNSQKKKTAYVSLFGKKDINAVRDDVLSQLFIINKGAEYIKTALDKVKSSVGIDCGLGKIELGMVGGLINVAVNLLERKSFANIILCIDDFERKSDELGCVELIGYVSILSEKYGCNIILLMDEAKLKDSELSRYMLYKEKFVDYEFLFKVNQLDIIQGMLEIFDSGMIKIIAMVLARAKENNLRVVKKSCNVIKRILSELDSDSLSISNETKIHISDIVSKFICIYTRIGLHGLDKVRECWVAKISGNNKCKDLPEYRFCTCFPEIFYQPSEQIDRYIWEIICGELPERSMLVDSVKQFEENRSNREYAHDVFAKLDAFTFDVKIKPQEFEMKMQGYLKGAPKNIISLLGLNNFLFLVDSLKEISKNVVKWDEYKCGRMVSYMDTLFESIHSASDYDSAMKFSDMLAVCKQEPKAQEQHDLLMKRLRERFQSVDAVLKSMTTIMANSGWDGQQVNDLNTFPISEIRHGIETSPVFLETLVDFLRWVGEDLGSPFADFRASSMATLHSLGEEHLGKFRYNRLIGIAQDTIGH